MSAQFVWSKGRVLHSRVDFTHGGPVTTIYFNSLVDFKNYWAQCDQEIVVLEKDEIELSAPPGTVVKPLSQLPTFTLIREHIKEMYSVDIDNPPADAIEKVNAIAFFHRARSQPSVLPNRIKDITRKINYDGL